MINKVKDKIDTSHKNHMNGNSWFLQNPINTLQMIAASSFFGEPKFYKEKGDVVNSSYIPPSLPTIKKYLSDILEEVYSKDNTLNSNSIAIEKAIDNALDFDPERTLQLAVSIRNDWNMRTTPQVILVRAANHPKVKGTSLIRAYAPFIIKRADEPATGLAYQLSVYGRKGIPNSLKRAWRTYFNNASEYSLAKYTMKNRIVKSVDVMNLVHPKSENIAKLAKGELSQKGETWEAIISEKGSNTAAWTEALSVMGHMALLRNIRNLISNKISPNLFINKLKEGVATGKQLPFRYYSAYKSNMDAPASVKDALEDCLIMSIDNIPKFKGKTMSLCDNSGSAWGACTSSMGTMRIAEIANLTALLTALASEQGFVGRFGDTLVVEEIRKRGSIFEKLDQYTKSSNSIGGSTENGIWLFWDKAIKEKQHWDNIFIYSDMQAGHGGLYGNNPSLYNEYRWQKTNKIDVPKLVNEYRRSVNPNVNVFLVQIAGYSDSIMPDFYNKTYIIGGWSDQLLKFASEIISLSELKN